MKNFLFRLLVYLICAFVMMIGFSFFYSWPKGFGVSSVWLDVNYIGLFIIVAPIIYIINDLIRIIRKSASENKK